MSLPRCIVVGSSFVDYVAYCDRVPAGGETVHSTSFQKGFGGKGANQAFQVAIMKNDSVGEVSMVSAVGKDGDGDAYISNLQSVGVDTRLMQQIDKESTGLAMISVSTVNGQNQIVICPNATHMFTPDTIDWDAVFGVKEEGEGRPQDILVVQNEIPLETTLRALEEASKRGIFTIFNPAPAPSTAADLDAIRPFMKYVDIFCPNENEAALMCGVPPGTVTKDNAEATCNTLRAIGAKSVVMTMGSQGYSISAKDGTFSFFPSFTDADAVDGQAFKVVDTTGAGDCFVGTMTSYLLAHGRERLAEACDAANGAAYLSVQRKGTQSSFPTAAEAAKRAPSRFAKKE